MDRHRSLTVTILIWSTPPALVAALVAGNVVLAGAYARIFGAAGLGPGAGVGFWALFFGALALSNVPAWAAFAGWVRAERREQAAQAEIRAALRWPQRLDRWQPRLWPEIDALPATAPAPAAGGVAALYRHLPYLVGFLSGLAGPIALAGWVAGA